MTVVTACAGTAGGIVGEGACFLLLLLFEETIACLPELGADLARFHCFSLGVRGKTRKRAHRFRAFNSSNRSSSSSLDVGSWGSAIILQAIRLTASLGYDREAKTSGH